VLLIIGFSSPERVLRKEIGDVDAVGAAFIAASPFCPGDRKYARARLFSQRR